MMQRTPLFASHQRLGGRLIDFGGWEMPVQYTSIVDEHLAVRRAAGIFDISHMGEVLVYGPQAEAFLNRVLTNDVRRLSTGQGQYTLMCNQQGGVIDDLYLYHLGPARASNKPPGGGNEYLLIVNASRTDADIQWLQSEWKNFADKDGVCLQNISAQTAAVALQGPRAADFISQCISGASVAGTSVTLVTNLKKNEIARFDYQGQEVWVAKTGYTGEDGFEIVAPNEIIERLWEELLEAGRAHGLKPAGLGARDTLRTEMCYPLYGHELDEQTTPIEAGLSFFVALDKPTFNGRDVLAAQKANGPARKLVAFKMTAPSAPPRPHYPVWHASSSHAPAGEVCSGTQSPSLNAGIGLAYVPAEIARPGTDIEVEIRSRRFPAVTVRKPVYNKAS